MKAEGFLDKGNGSSKVLSVVEGIRQSLFKIPVVTRIGLSAMRVVASTTDASRI